MREVLIKKIEELGTEAQALVEQRDKMFAVIQEIEVRLHQISGAISEIDKLLKSEDKNEAGKDGDTGVSEGNPGTPKTAPAN